MENIRIKGIQNLDNPQFVKPYKLLYEQNGKPLVWELCKTHQSVAVLIFNKDRKCLVFVKQFRPAVFLSSIPLTPDQKVEDIKFDQYETSNGITLELCAGIVDKNKPLAEIAADEVLEECGYEVDPSTLEMVSCFRCNVGISGDKMTLFYVEVDDSMRRTSGGGVDDEFIEVVELSIEETREITQCQSFCGPGELLYALMWFFSHKVCTYS